ncbi:MAG TPA: hypothetical protein DHN33_08215, partial [Eubacteriaceae bacterium]|nr:hypothetical protein [Eubacteriaceae bacterium]
EGYMDVISLYKAGVKNVVASLGTALTREQLLLLKRYAEEVVLCYDGDEAGQRAMLKGIEIANALSMQTRILRLPNQMDPDDYIKRQGVEAFYGRVEQAEAPIHYRIHQLSNQYQLNDTQQQIRFIHEAAKIIGELNDPVERQMYIKSISSDMQITPKSLWTEVEKQKSSNREERSSDNRITAIPQRKDNAYEKAQRILIKTMFEDEKKARVILDRIQTDLFAEGVYRKSAEYIRHCLDLGEKFDLSRFAATLDRQEDIQRISALTLEESSLEEEIIEELVVTIQTVGVKNKIASIQSKMQADNDEATLNSLYHELLQSKKELEMLQNNERRGY